MSDAIEVLKDLMEDINIDLNKNRNAYLSINKKDRDAMSEALLALEQKEKLKSIFSNELLESIIQDAYDREIGSVERDLRELWKEVKDLEK